MPRARPRREHRARSAPGLAQQAAEWRAGCRCRWPPSCRCALVLAAVGVFEFQRAVWLALGIGLATLAAQGVRYAQVGLGRLGTLAVVAISLALGLLIVALKALVAHWPHRPASFMPCG